MDEIGKIRTRLFDIYENKELWIDPYDSEMYNNRYIRGITKKLMYFFPRELHCIGAVRRHVWPENLELLGKCFLTLGDVEQAEHACCALLELGKGAQYWGLPIDWKTTNYVFPKGTMMSTTTAEIALFFVELSKLSSLVTRNILQSIAHNLLNGLYRVYEDADRLILGYTPYDNYRVLNANLLVAAALSEIGNALDDKTLIRAAVKITNACVDGIYSNGGIPYQMNGQNYDSYHQIFSLRALLLLKQHSTIFVEAFDRAIGFLRYNLMNSDGTVFLAPSKDIIDLQGAAEALYFFSILGDLSTATLVHNQIDALLRKPDGSYIQRRWNNRFGAILSRTMFTRQGELRLLLGKLAFMKATLRDTD